jgi:hypothetical protein
VILVFGIHSQTSFPSGLARRAAGN